MTETLRDNPGPPTQRRYRTSQRRAIPSSKWAVMMSKYVTGEIGSWVDIAEQLGIAVTSVQKRANKEDWTGLRQAFADRVKERVMELPPLALERGKESLERLEAAQTTLADSVLALGHSSVSMVSEINASITAISQRLGGAVEGGPDCTAQLATRLASLVSARDSIMTQIRILAGLQDPDKRRSEPKQDSTTKPTPSKSRPEPTGPITQPASCEQDSDES